MFDVDVTKPEKKTTDDPIEESIEIQKVQPKTKQSKIITVDLGNGKLGKISEKEFEKIGDSE